MYFQNYTNVFAQCNSEIAETLERSLRLSAVPGKSLPFQSSINMAAFVTQLSDTLSFVNVNDLVVDFFFSSVQVVVNKRQPIAVSEFKRLINGSCLQ